MKNLRTDGDRLWTSLMETAAIGGTPDGGIRRLALGDEDRQVRDWFRAACEAIGCRVTVDAVGNMFARREGRRADLAPIAMGSHLDTQPTGGRFDGALGVLAGLEVLRSLDAAAYETEHPLLLVNWTNEEGARFSPAMLGSAAHAGVFEHAYVEARTDAEGVRFADALERIGYHGSQRIGATAIGAMFELHIEQGPILERSGKTIGVVTGIQGMRWYDVEIHGQSAHAGSTPLDMRRDALCAAARLVLSLEGLARSHGGLATVGEISVVDASRNVVPGHVRLTADLRHEDDGVLEAMEQTFLAALETLDPATRAAAKRIWNSPPVRFNSQCVGAVEDAAREAGLSAMRIVSGAGHDSANVARIAPTTMIFVPCKDGLSHNPAESATREDCAAGAQVLLDAVLGYDRRATAFPDDAAPTPERTKT